MPGKNSGEVARSLWADRHGQRPPCLVFASVSHMALRAKKIALIGDLHGKWTAPDNEFFNDAAYDLLLFVGDLGSGTLRNELALIRLISEVRVPGLVLPGNNDAPFLGHLAAEFAHQNGALALREIIGAPRGAHLELCGYSNHELETDGALVTLIAGRPCAMGGSEFSFAQELSRNYGVTSLVDSTHRLKAQVDDARTDALIFLGHNGPFGLGGNAGDLWARDFSLPHAENPPLDWGDTDLADAVQHAKHQGRDVLGVIGGHMHRRPGDNDRFSVLRDGTLYVNPGVVPRIVSNSEGERHHFVELLIDLKSAEPRERFVAEERWVEV